MSALPNTRASPPIERLASLLDHRTLPFAFLPGAVPIPRAPASPTGANDPDPRRSCAPAVEALERAISAWGGQVLTQARENGGRPIRWVCPRQGQVQQASSHGAVRFGAHTDNPDAPWDAIPEALFFVCLRGEAGVATQLLRVSTVVERLHPRARTLLCDARFALAPPASCAQGGLEPAPILHFAAGGAGWMCRFDAHRTRALDGQARWALREFERTAADPELWTSIELKAGDMLFFSNLTVLHRRDGWSPRLDGTDRLLFRAYAHKVPQGEAHVLAR